MVKITRGGDAVFSSPFLWNGTQLEEREDMDSRLRLSGMTDQK
jgi:hypothetical protein